MKYAFIGFVVGCILALGMEKCSASDWTTEEKTDEIIYQTLNAVDTLQTVYIAEHPSQYMESESARFIGVHPSREGVYYYMASSAILHFAVTDILYRTSAPTWLKRTWQAVTIGDKANAIRGNFSVGIKLAF